MRKILSVLLLTVAILLFAACEFDDGEKSHNEIISEISEKNKSYHEKRQAFMTSDVYDLAYAYVINTLNEILPGCEANISLEPGNLIDDDLVRFRNFSEKESTRLKFFSGANLYIKVNFWSFDKDALQLCSDLMSRQISCRLAADEYGGDVYKIDATSQKAEFKPMPEV